jgi:hypothetical protein
MKLVCDVIQCFFFFFTFFNSNVFLVSRLFRMGVFLWEYCNSGCHFKRGLELHEINPICFYMLVNLYELIYEKKLFEIMILFGKN